MSGLLPPPEPAPARTAVAGVVRLPLRSGVFLVSARSLSESGGIAAAWCPRVRQRSEAVDVDRGQLGYPSLDDFPVVIDLDKLALVGGRSAGGRHRRRCCDTRAKPSWPSPACEPPVRSEPAPAGRLRWLRDERDQPDVAATRRALERELLAQPGHEFRPGNPRTVVRPGLRMRSRPPRPPGPQPGDRAICCLRRAARARRPTRRLRR